MGKSLQILTLSAYHISHIYNQIKQERCLTNINI